MFTDPNQSRTDNESPISIGEALDGSTHKRNHSNPFLPEDAENGKWEGEKKQFLMQMKLMKEQLDGEKAARIESQVSNPDSYIPCRGNFQVAYFTKFKFSCVNWCRLIFADSCYRLKQEIP